MTLADISKGINCLELRATSRMPSGDWNLYCKRDGKRTNAEMCAGCRKRQEIKKKKEQFTNR